MYPHPVTNDPHMIAPVGYHGPEQVFVHQRQQFGHVGYSCSDASQKEYGYHHGSFSSYRSTVNHHGHPSFPAGQQTRFHDIGWSDNLENVHPPSVYGYPPIMNKTWHPGVQDVHHCTNFISAQAEDNLRSRNTWHVTSAERADRPGSPPWTMVYGNQKSASEQNVIPFSASNHHGSHEEQPVRKTGRERIQRPRKNKEFCQMRRNVRGHTAANQGTNHPSHSQALDLPRDHTQATSKPDGICRSETLLNVKLLNLPVTTNKSNGRVPTPKELRNIIIRVVALVCKQFPQLTEKFLTLERSQFMCVPDELCKCLLSGKLDKATRNMLMYYLQIKPLICPVLSGSKCKLCNAAQANPSLESPLKNSRKGILKQKNPQLHALLQLSNPDKSEIQSLKEMSGCNQLVASDDQKREENAEIHRIMPTDDTAIKQRAASMMKLPKTVAQKYVSKPDQTCPDSYSQFFIDKPVNQEIASPRDVIILSPKLQDDDIKSVVPKFVENSDRGYSDVSNDWWRPSAPEENLLSRRSSQPLAPNEQVAGSEDNLQSMFAHEALALTTFTLEEGKDDLEVTTVEFSREDWDKMIQ